MRASGHATRFLLITALAAAPGTAAGQTPEDPRAGRVDQVFARWTESGSPGAAVVVVKDGSVILEKGYGHANLDHGIAITPTTLFDIASVSKHFTAFAVAMLADQGRLSLDDDVRKHVPEVPDFGHQVTLRHLIHHTSGIRDWVELLSIGGFRFDDVIAPHDIMAFLRRQEALNFVPGAEHLYSNTGYNLLAETVARVTGQPFAEFIEQHVFRPLGMTATHIQTDHQRVVSGRATSYAPNENVDELSNLHARPPAADGTWRVWVDNTSAPGSSSVVTSVTELARWMRNLETGEVGGTGVLRQMVQRGRLNDGREIGYAFGLSLDERRGIRAVSHGGGWRGFRTHLLWFPDQHLSIAVLGNSTAFNAGAAAMQVAEIYLGDRLAAARGTQEQAAPRSRSRTPAETPATTTRLADYAGTYSSAELGTSYTVLAEDGRLVARHRKMPDQLLSPAGPDRFVTPGVRGELTYQFVRDADGRVTGYRLAGARFRNVPFVRQRTTGV